MKVLLVCTGNTCRSAMAEALLRRLLDETARPPGRPAGPAWEVASAGTSALPGAPATPAAVQALQERGLDLSGHRARQLTAQVVQSSHLVLTMTREQKRAVLAMAPGAAGRVFTLREFLLGPEAALPLEAAAEEARRRLARAREEFRARHRAELEALERRRGELAEQLEGVEDEIEAWARREAEATRAESEAVAGAESRQRGLDVPDPFGRPVEDYRACAEGLEDDLCALAGRLAEGWRPA